jgi:hypothetical protein
MCRDCSATGIVDSFTLLYCDCDAGIELRLEEYRCPDCNHLECECYPDDEDDTCD